MNVPLVLTIIVVLFGLPHLDFFLGALMVIVIYALLHIAQRATIIGVIVELLDFSSAYILLHLSH